MSSWRKPPKLLDTRTFFFLAHVLRCDEVSCNWCSKISRFRRHCESRAVTAVNSLYRYYRKRPISLQIRLRDGSDARNAFTSDCSKTKLKSTASENGGLPYSWFVYVLVVLGSRKRGHVHTNGRRYRRHVSYAFVWIYTHARGSHNNAYSAVTCAARIPARALKVVPAVVPSPRNRHVYHTTRRYGWSPTPADIWFLNKRTRR